MEKYTEDEILIFAGKFADKAVKDFLYNIQSNHVEAIRNAIADAAEGAMSAYKGIADVPLPKDLLEEMGRVGQAAASQTLTEILNPVGGEGF